MTSERDRNPLFSPAVILLAALSLSIGWGIRGNFGHEAGAMIPGALTAIVVAVCSRREDWQSRIPHAALFGGLGYGFGGSISYMYPISFTHSGQFDTMFYGYLTTYLEGGLWCAMGVAGAALALTAPRDRLAAIYPPLLCVLGFLFVKQWGEDGLNYLLSPEQNLASDTWHRQEAPLYWFDADWFAALTALIGVCAYDLASRKFARWWVLLLSVGGLALIGFLIQLALDKAGLLETLVESIAIPQGDPNYIDPATGQPFPTEEMMTNWPQFFGDYPQHVGWLVGAFLGFVLYFAIWGQWKNDSGLFAAMAGGWLFAFLAMPVFGTIFMMEYGGFRMTPPRSDDWAGIVGVFLGMLFWSWRRDLRLVTLAGTLSFLLGGLGFTTAQLLRTMARIPGHPFRSPGEHSEFLQHFQSANWHSILEQSQGFCLGLATIITLAIIWRRAPADTSGVRMPGWTTIFAVLFTLFGLTFMNLYKVVGTWTTSERAVMPEWLTAPLIEFIELPAIAWFNLAWWAAALAAFALCVRNQKQPLAFLPASDAGRGQLLWLAVVWIMVLGNFSRALPGFSEGRLITEWVVFINACIATALLGVPNVTPLAAFAARRDDVVAVLASGHREDPFSMDLEGATPRAAVAVPELPDSPQPTKPRWALLKLVAIWIVGLAIAIPAMYGYAKAVDAAYGGANVEALNHAHRRFGPDAIWRTNPILKHGEHR